MLATREATRISGTVSHHGEGPLWCPDDKLRWVDMLVGDVLTLDSDGVVVRTHVGSVAAALRPRESGGFMVAVERGFAFLSESSKVIPLPELWDHSMARMNEGSCDASGNFYCGSMGWNAEPGLGNMYRLGTDGVASVVHGGLTISNGLAFTSDGGSAYFVDSADSAISRVRVSRGHPSWSDRTQFVSIDKSLGTPDGICLDSEGGVWVALWGGGVVHRYAANGALTDVVAVPTTNPTACTLGGDNLTRLYITTSRLGVTNDAHAGAVFVANVDVPGIRPLPYRG